MCPAIRGIGLCLSGCLLAQAQTAARKNTEVLDHFSESVQALAASVAPSVVQISVTRFAAREDSGVRTAMVLDR